MGIVIGKFRKKKTTLEILEKLDKEIKAIEDFRKDTEQSHKRIVGRFVVVSVGVYLITACVFYFYFFPDSFYDRILGVLPLVFAAVLIFSTKKILTWYYNRKLRKNQGKLSTLKDQKKKMLEEVMDKETYKVAKDILEKFAPEQVVRRNNFTTTSIDTTPMKPSITPGLRHRALLPSMNQTFRPSLPAQTPNLPTLPAPGDASNLHLNTSLVQGNFHLQPTKLPLPRAILPRERSVVDKMVEYLVGDGPSNRYALICKQCCSHNGMALKEEFEYISYRCCYCYTLNPARKKRPQAPKLNSDLQMKDDKDTSESEKNSASDTESEPETTPPNILTFTPPELKTIFDAKEKDDDDDDLDKSKSDLNEELNIIEAGSSNSSSVEEETKPASPEITPYSSIEQIE